MKNFKDFIDSKERKSIKQYNEDYGDCLEGDGDLWCYQEYYHIIIDDYKKMGYESKEMYHLTLENDCDSSENLSRLEHKLYHWFVSQNEDGWLYNVGIHNPKTTPLYFVVFQDMGFDVEDISYSNDECDCLRLSMVGKALYDVYLPNSAMKDWDVSKFNTFHLLRLDDNDDRIEKDLDNNLSLKECIDWIEEDLHQKARDIICQMNDSASDLCNGLNDKISLDDYLVKNHNIVDKDLLRKARIIESYFNNLKPLDESTLFGSEPSQMFDDGEMHNKGAYLFVLDFNIGEVFRYTITPQMRKGRYFDNDFFEEILFKNNHKIEDCNWMVCDGKTITKIENY